jgi:hypothetical protein
VNDQNSRRSCLIFVILILASIAGAVWYVTDFGRTPSTGTMPSAPRERQAPDAG